MRTIAEFNWFPAPPNGTCLGCGSSQNDRGFVNTHAEVALRREDYDISGIADVIFCAQCLEQMGRLVGLASPAETEQFARDQYERETETDKLKDEVAAWQTRFDVLMDESFAKSVRKVVENAAAVRR